jgi:hypothetical protein
MKESKEPDFEVSLERRGSREAISVDKTKKKKKKQKKESKKSADE